MGIVNGSNSLIEKLSIMANGRDVYSCNYANHVVNIKNLLEYNLPTLIVLLQMNFTILIQQDMLKDKNLHQEE